MPPKRKLISSQQEDHMNPYIDPLSKEDHRPISTTIQDKPSLSNYNDNHYDQNDTIQYHLISQAPFMMTQDDFAYGGIAYSNPPSLDPATVGAKKKRGRKPKDSTLLAMENHPYPSAASNHDFDFDISLLKVPENLVDSHTINSPPKKRPGKSVKPQSLSQDASPSIANPLLADKSRRIKRPWTVEEEEYLRQGVEKYGLGNWAKIRDDETFQFQEGRTSVDLKDKWRNIMNFKRYKEHEIRKYVLLNEKHEFYVTYKNGKSSGYHYFHNRWPREAALKVAARDEFYNSPEDSGPIMIYLRETRPPQSGDEKQESVVHVYKGRRERKIAIDIPKFKDKQYMWEPFVVKVREEHLSAGHYAVLPAHELPEEFHHGADDSLDTMTGIPDSRQMQQHQILEHLQSVQQHTHHHSQLNDPLY